MLKLLSTLHEVAWHCNSLACAKSAGLTFVFDIFTIAFNHCSVQAGGSNTTELQRDRFQNLTCIPFHKLDKLSTVHFQLVLFHPPTSCSIDKFPRGCLEEFQPPLLLLLSLPRALCLRMHSQYHKLWGNFQHSRPTSPHLTNCPTG